MSTCLEQEYKICDICGFKTNVEHDDILIFGNWMQSHGITVHYFCMLLSTDLPQRGKDCVGILGFLIRDIRAEIRKASTRMCYYCSKPKASIACKKCGKRFHLVCGHRNECLFQFVGEFNSYCHDCIPLDQYQLKALKDPPKDVVCIICRASMGSAYNPIKWLHAPCCGNGFVHAMCLRRFALASGYYLICIYCRKKSFRDLVRYLGIFIPDRDAQWELEENAYADLHRGHKRCNMETCHCPKGRDYSSPKWAIIVCTLCGSFGTHNPKCIPGREWDKDKVKEFKCDTCRRTEETILSATRKQHNNNPTISNHLHEKQMYALHMIKSHHMDVDESTVHNTPEFSDNSSTFESTFNTVVTHCKAPQQLTREAIAEDVPHNVTEEFVPQHDEDASNANIIEVSNWYEFDEELNCTGRSTVRINMHDARFANISIDDLFCRCRHIIVPQDRINHTADIGIFNIINGIIEKSQRDMK